MFAEILRLGVPWTIPKNFLVRPSETTALRPDVVVLDERDLAQEPLWEKQSILTSGKAQKDTEKLTACVQGEMYMTTKDLILQELEKTPEDALVTVLSFIQFLHKTQAQERFQTALLSESALKKDWLLPEEDEAWQHL